MSIVVQCFPAPKLLVHMLDSIFHHTSMNVGCAQGVKNGVLGAFLHSSSGAILCALHAGSHINGSFNSTMVHYVKYAQVLTPLTHFRMQ